MIVLASSISNSVPLVREVALEEREVSELGFCLILLVDIGKDIVAQRLVEYLEQIDSIGIIWLPRRTGNCSSRCKDV